jgi:FAD:protein FMN transferase
MYKTIMKKILIIITILLLGVSCFFVFRINYKLMHPEFQKRTRFLMDTVCTIMVPGDRTVYAAIDKAFNRMEEIDSKFNAYNKNSPIYKFNYQNIPITDNEIVDVVTVALEIAGKSDGAFDITVQRLVTLWGFGTDKPEVPRPEDIKKCLRDTGYKNIYIENNTIKKRIKNIGIDLGGIAKGYAVKEAAQVLKKEGISSAIINAGGDIYAMGNYSGNHKWKVGIQHPRDSGIFGVVNISNISVVTSGDYERYFEKNGMRYHHIFNPATGYPATGLMSLTVLTPDNVYADALSTAIFVLGKTRGLALAASMPRVEIVGITDKGEIFCSPGLRSSKNFYLTNTNKGEKK